MIVITDAIVMNDEELENVVGGAAFVYYNEREGRAGGKVYDALVSSVALTPDEIKVCWANRKNNPANFVHRPGIQNITIFSHFGLKKAKFDRFINENIQSLGGLGSKTQVAGF